MLQAVRIRTKELFGSKNPPLNYVDEFMKVDRIDPITRSAKLFCQQHPIGQRSSQMSDCLHCDIHELLESRLQDKEANLEEIAAKAAEKGLPLQAWGRIAMVEAHVRV